MVRNPDLERYQVNYKVDNKTHKLLLELANRRTKGILADMARLIMEEWLQLLPDESGHSVLDSIMIDDSSPIELRKVAIEYQRARRRDMANSHIQAWKDLQVFPDTKYESILEAEAEKWSLPWPPDVSKEPDLITPRIINGLSDLWESEGNRTTLRSLQRKLNWTISDGGVASLRSYIRQLESLGEVMILGNVETENSPIVICNPQLQNSKVS